jgi:hypothetical protein
MIIRRMRSSKQDISINQDRYHTVTLVMTWFDAFVLFPLMIMG